MKPLALEMDLRKILLYVIMEINVASNRMDFKFHYHYLGFFASLFIVLATFLIFLEHS